MIRIWQIIAALWYIGGFVVCRWRLWDERNRTGTPLMMYVGAWFISLLLALCILLVEYRSIIFNIFMLEI